MRAGKSKICIMNKLTVVARGFSVRVQSIGGSRFPPFSLVGGSHRRLLGGGGGGAAAWALTARLMERLVIKACVGATLRAASCFEALAQCAYASLGRRLEQSNNKSSG